MGKAWYGGTCFYSQMETGGSGVQNQPKSHMTGHIWGQPGLCDTLSKKKKKKDENYQQQKRMALALGWEETGKVEEDLVLPL